MAQAKCRKTETQIFDEPGYDLPLDLTTNIFMSLDLLDIITCQRVCSRFNNITKTPGFWVTYFPYQRPVRTIIQFWNHIISDTGELHGDYQEVEREKKEPSLPITDDHSRELLICGQLIDSFNKNLSFTDSESVCALFCVNSLPGDTSSPILQHIQDNLEEPDEDRPKAVSYSSLFEELEEDYEDWLRDWSDESQESDEEGKEDKDEKEKVEDASEDANEKKHKKKQLAWVGRFKEFILKLDRLRGNFFDEKMEIYQDQQLEYKEMWVFGVTKVSRIRCGIYFCRAGLY